MSWSASGKITKKLDTEPSLEMEQEQTQTGNGERESKDALNAAKDAAVSLVQTGGFGYGTFDVRLSGHANSGNAPLPGWSNDWVTITISQKS